MAQKEPRMFEGNLDEKTALFSAIFESTFKNKSQLLERINEYKSYILKLQK